MDLILVLIGLIHKDQLLYNIIVIELKFKDCSLIQIVYIWKKISAVSKYTHISLLSIMAKAIFLMMTIILPWPVNGAGKYHYFSILYITAMLKL